MPKMKDDASIGPDLPQTLVRIPIEQAEEAKRRVEDDQQAAD